MKTRGSYCIKKKGFTALISALCLSLVLLDMSILVAAQVVSQRFAFLSLQLHEEKRNIAKACISQALALISRQPGYTSNLPQKVSFGSNFCTIISIFNEETTATIITQATDGEGEVTLRAVISKKPLSISAWEET